MNIPSNVSNLQQILVDPLVLFPCVGKRPVRKGWRKLTAACMTPAHLASLATGNIGIATGEPSAGCCALDIDTADGLQNFLALVPAAQAWPCLVGARGAKLFVRIEGGYPGKHPLTLNGAKWGDWVSTGALAIVHGIHPDTKKLYEWTVRTTVQTISFSLIKDALSALHVQQGGVKTKQKTHILNTPPPTNSSVSCNLNPESCVLDTASCILHNKGNAENIVAKIKARKELRGLVGKSLKPLERLFEHYIEERFEAAAGDRNGFLVAAIPFLIRCVSPAVALELVMMFYYSHSQLFNDPPAQHEAEAVAMIRGVEETYLTELSEGERSVFSELDVQSQSAFRICRDLAYRPDARIPLVFFMACNELGSRLQIKDMQASRLLHWFERWKIIATVEKGERRQQGKPPKASSYRWLLGTAPVNTQTEGGQTK